ncbi:hypothetical protein NDU88_000945 [Pleurodeles waltl]|uniref:Uncharacterized protein n=1 Tax=Pleurodeles waltl TaxID=8319 RepID=A0AAV7NDE3_PLEWA|nr:hypothetical protein NDU88_000945 [Pleurodeles waltl]
MQCPGIGPDWSGRRGPRGAQDGSHDQHGRDSSPYRGHRSLRPHAPAELWREHAGCDGGLWSTWAGEGPSGDCSARRAGMSLTLPSSVSEWRRTAGSGI